MKTILQILILTFILISCKKNELPNELSTVTWKLNSLIDGLNKREYEKIIEYYDDYNTITKKEYYSTDIVYTDTYKYNNEGQLIEFKGELTGSYKYDYKNGLLVKKEFYDFEQKFLQYYDVFEYSNSVLEKKYHYNSNSILTSTLVYYYSSDKLDSIYHFYQNNLDSIEGKEVYIYDTSNNLIKTQGWKWSEQEQQFYPAGKDIYNCENKKRTRMEMRDENNELLGLIYDYKYDSKGRMYKIEIYSDDGLLGYYDATFSKDNYEYTIPEL